MFKEIFKTKTDNDATTEQPAVTALEKTNSGSSGAESPSKPHWELAATKGRTTRPPAKMTPVSEIVSPNRGPLESFEEIYRNAPVKPPMVAYTSLGILRVIDMVHSPHLDGMSLEGKRSAVLMALEAVGVKAEDLLQDAMVRQRALNVYEESQQAKLRDLEVAKQKENSLIRAELDRLSAAHLSRIQANLDEIARMQDNLRQWIERKVEESQQIAEAATFCASQASAAGASLTATVTRFGADAVMGKSADAAAGGKR
jgi:hypothetical protein